MAKRVIALGFFDGVHTGHGRLLEKTVDIAKKTGFLPSVMTYSNHPSEILAPAPVGLINTMEERCELIRELYGIEDIIVKEFTSEYASLSCENFFEKIILNELNAGYVVAGFDFRFGKGGSGDGETLRSLCEKNGIGCEIIGAVMHGGEAVSSSRIRECIKRGDVAQAAELLGHYHCRISTVERGRRIGTEIGFPTVNQPMSGNICIPKYGVYATRVTIGEKNYFGVTNVGIAPTVTDAGIPRAETNILGFDGDLYGKRIKVEFLGFIREEKKFASKEELSKQIAADTETANSFCSALF